MEVSSLSGCRQTGYGSQTSCCTTSEHNNKLKTWLNIFIDCWVLFTLTNCQSYIIIYFCFVYSQGVYKEHRRVQFTETTRDIFFH